MQLHTDAEVDRLRHELWAAEARWAGAQEEQDSGRWPVHATAVHLYAVDAGGSACPGHVYLRIVHDMAHALHCMPVFDRAALHGFGTPLGAG